MKRPRVEIQKEPLDNFLDIIGWIGVVAMIGLAAYYYGQLPEEIPRHFNAKGEPDAYGGKNSIWILPILGVALFLLLFFLNKKPHIFNFPEKITEENAAFHYRRATRMIRWINTGTVVIFLYITWQTIQTALGNSTGLGTAFLAVILISVAGLLGYTFGKTQKK